MMKLCYFKLLTLWSFVRQPSEANAIWKFPDVTEASGGGVGSSGVAIALLKILTLGCMELDKCSEKRALSLQPC